MKPKTTRRKIARFFADTRKGILAVRARIMNNISPRAQSALSVESRALLAPEDFQNELVKLGLSGKEFGPEDYREALEAYLGMPILVRVFPDVHYPEYMLELARSGDLGLVRCGGEPPKAVVLVPTSLPPLVCTLAIYHELGHLAAGDLGPGRTEPSRRLAHKPPLTEERMREEEADLRAYYALIAGSLGPSSPYVALMYDAL